MPSDHPDGTTRMLIVDLVGDDVIAETAANETPISRTRGKVTNSDETYQILATWTVGTSRNGRLTGLGIYLQIPTKTRVRLTIGGIVQWTDIEWPTAVNPFFAGTRMPASTVVLLEGKSSDGTQVDMWGTIEGTEVG